LHRDGDAVTRNRTALALVVIGLAMAIIGTRGQSPVDVWCSLHPCTVLAAQPPDQAASVFVGRVLRLEPRWEQTASGRVIVSRVYVKAESVSRGKAPAFVDVVGGTLDGWTLRVSHLPSLRVGDVATFHLDADGKLDRKRGGIAGLPQAFLPLGLTWPSTPVPYYINPRNDDGLDVASVIAAIRRGAEAWSTQTRANFAMQYAGATSGSSFQPNYVSEVFFTPTSPGAIAEAYLWSYGSTLADVDIAFYDAGALFFTDHPCAGGYYVEDVSAHEFGHFLGLGHSSVFGATMSPTSAACETGYRLLDPDDISGAEALYPPVTSPPPDPEPGPNPCELDPIVLSVQVWPTKGKQKTAAVYTVWSPRGNASVTFTYRGQQSVSATASDGICSVTVTR
jgi:hypothetical protein